MSYYVKRTQHWAVVHAGVPTLVLRDVPGDVTDGEIRARLGLEENAIPVVAESDWSSPVAELVDSGDVPTLRWHRQGRRPIGPRVVVYLPQDLVDQIDQEADGGNRSAWIRELVLDRLRPEALDER